MSQSNKEASLEAVFTVQQAGAVRAAVASGAGIGRAQFEELKGLLERVLLRLDAVAPENAVPPEHLAIMSAVFAAYIGKRVRVRSARPVRPHSSWAQAGRVSLHSQRHLTRP
jgi:hypothetical protein